MFGIDDRRYPSSANPSYYSIYMDNAGVPIDQDPIICFPQQQITITYQHVGNHIVSFTIINLDGVIYTFNEVQKSISSIKYGSNAASIDGHEYVSTWFLTEIRNPNGQVEASFEYEQNENYSVTSYLDEVKTITSEGSINYVGEFDDSDPFNTPGPCMMPIDRIKRTMVSNKMKNVRLSRISTINGKIEFIKGAEREDMVNDFVLDQIRYSNADDVDLDIPAKLTT